MTSPKVALIETKPSKTDFSYEFGGAFAFDQFSQTRIFKKAKPSLLKIYQFYELANYNLASIRATSMN